MTKNKLKKIFLVAFKERTDGSITVIYPDNKPEYFDSKEKAEEYYNELIENKKFTANEIEAITFWQLPKTP